MASRRKSAGPHQPVELSLRALIKYDNAEEDISDGLIRVRATLADLSSCADRIRAQLMGIVFRRFANGTSPFLANDPLIHSDAGPPNIHDDPPNTDASTKGDDDTPTADSGNVMVAKLTVSQGRATWTPVEGYTPVIMASEELEIMNKDGVIFANWLTIYTLRVGGGGCGGAGGVGGSGATNGGGVILQNLRLFTFWHKSVPAIKYGKWTWPRQAHMDRETEMPNEQYWQWRRAGLHFSHPVRYRPDKIEPPLFALYPNTGSHTLDAILADDEEVHMERYEPENAAWDFFDQAYRAAVVSHPQFVALQTMRHDGTNLLILDPDYSATHQQTQGHLLRSCLTTM